MTSSLPQLVRDGVNGAGRLPEGIARQRLSEPPPLYDFEAMLAQPPIEYLIERLLPVGAFATLTGKYGTGKTFIALSWALAMGLNFPSWLGRAVKPGGALYVAAEGLRPERLEAYRQRYGVDSTPAVWWRRQALALKQSEQVDAILRQIEGLPVCPKLIVLDTYARCTVGLQENDASDTAFAVEEVGRLIRETGAAVLALHHPPHGAPDRSRGSTALDGAADATLLLKEREGGLVLTVTKQKDGALPPPLHLRLAPCGPSVVVELNDPDADDARALAGSQATALRVLAGIMVPDGVTMGEWIEAAAPMPKRTLMFARKRLLELERVKKKGARYLLSASASEVQS